MSGFDTSSAGRTVGDAASNLHRRLRVVSQLQAATDRPIFLRDREERWFPPVSTLSAEINGARHYLVGVSDDTLSELSDAELISASSTAVCLTDHGRSWDSDRWVGGVYSTHVRQSARLLITVASGFLGVAIVMGLASLFVWSQTFSVTLAFVAVVAAGAFAGTLWASFRSLLISPNGDSAYESLTDFSLVGPTDRQQQEENHGKAIIDLRDEPHERLRSRLGEGEKQ